MPEAETEFTKEEFKYLNLLAKQYPNISSASTEIINLQAILNLPKGTEHFISDIHGEYEAFSHVLRNASGVIKNHITYILGTSLRDSEKKTLATLIYYPEQKLEEIKKTEKDMDDWYRITLHRLVTICKAISAKYTRSKVRKALPPEFSYIIEELLHEDSTGDDKELYYNQIIESIIRLDQADRFITAISKLIQRLAIDRLHVIGDIYDRGPRASKIMDILEDYHSVDIQWGNHDISWMGAAAGCQALICNVIRIQARYCNLDTIEEDYGINLIPLATFAMEKYADDPCTYFMPKNSDADALSDKEVILTAKMHKAISIMQFKMEEMCIRDSIIADESHVSVPQIRGMYEGDRSRKTTLVEFGFRLPSALDNRPLKFNEFESKIKQMLFVSATPSKYEAEHSQQTVEQVIRPTGLLDPEITVKPVQGQIDDLISEVNKTVEAGHKVLVTTLTKKMAERLTDYMKEMGIRVRYLHSDIDTLERLEIIRDLRMDVFDVLIGINLLREGLDIPEVALVAILDADKEGFLRSETSLIQTIGRAARNSEGRVIMYADVMTDSMNKAITETYRRREIQIRYNEEHGIVPQTIKKKVYDIIQATKSVEENKSNGLDKDFESMDIKELRKQAAKTEKDMRKAAAELQFERAAELRDRLIEIKKYMNGE